MSAFMQQMYDPTVILDPPALVVTREMLLLAAAVVLLVAAVASLMLLYLWRKYGAPYPAVRRMTRVYYAGTALFVAGMFAGIFLYA